MPRGWRRHPRRRCRRSDVIPPPGCGIRCQLPGCRVRLRPSDSHSGQTQPWKTGAHGNTLNSKTSARVRRAISWRRCRCSEPRLVVDLGCGPGNSTELLVERYPQSEIVGLDSSPDMLRKARERLPKLKFVEADIATWSPEPDTDLLFSNAVMQWLPDHTAVLRRLLEALKPGGGAGGADAGQHPRAGAPLPRRGRTQRAVAGPSGSEGRAAARSADGRGILRPAHAGLFAHRHLAHRLRSRNGVAAGHRRVVQGLLAAAVSVAARRGRAREISRRLRREDCRRLQAAQSTARCC